MDSRHTLPIPFGWYGVAFSSELQAGEVKPLKYFDQDLVLFRTEDGVAHALEAFCPHLGAHLGYGGVVKGDVIACPFHAWEFNGEGHVKNIPYAKQIPPKIAGKQCLYKYPTVERNNTIWAWYHPQRVEPSFEVVELAETSSPEWTEFSHYDWEIDAAIQETAENAADAAHFTFVHSSRDVPKGEVHHQGPQRHAFFKSKTPSMDEQGNLDTTGTKWRDAELETSNCGPGQTWQRFTGLIDTLMLGVVTPITANRLHLRFAYTQKKSHNAAQKVMAKSLIDNISLQVEQDIPIWQHKIYRPEPILCDGDGPINQFRKWFGQFYAE
ncbi:MAG: aromatic ring-hydroxylating oxygenase subunit alpha [Pseudomonadales bacterium]